MRRLLLITVLALLALPAAEGWAAKNVELLNGRVQPVDHSASGRAAVVQINGGRRVLTLRSFRLAPGPLVRVYLVPRGVRRDGDVRKDFKDLGRLKGSRGNQQYTIPGSVDLRRYRSVIFWCVPFTAILARSDLQRS
jgi:hypothetical protein